MLYNTTTYQIIIRRPTSSAFALYHVKARKVKATIRRAQQEAREIEAWYGMDELLQAAGINGRLELLALREAAWNYFSWDGCDWNDLIDLIAICHDPSSKHKCRKRYEKFMKKHLSNYRKRGIIYV